MTTTAPVRPPARFKHEHFAVALILLTVLAGCAHPTSPYVSSRCPLPVSIRGFPLIASSTDPVNPALLRAIARAVAGRWNAHEPDSREADPMSAVARRLRASIDHGDSFRRGDWTPVAGDTAQLLIICRRGRELPEIRLPHPGRATRIESLLRSSAADALKATFERQPMHEPLPLALPMTGGDSIVVAVALGHEPRAQAEVARFSVRERDVRPAAGNRPPPYPAWARSIGYPGDVTLGFVVRPDSTADLSTVYVIQSTAGDFVDVARRALATYRFIPAQLDCVPVAELVQEPFMFRMRAQSTP